jgi:aspartate kinase
VFAAGLAAAGCEAELVDAGELVRTDASFGEGNVDLPASTALAMRRLSGVRSAVVPGFFGADAQGHTVLLGRGGSDTTATVLGAALGAEQVEIWTDVDGVLTADPRRVSEARTLPFLTYADAADAAALGAKVLHSRSLAPAAAAGVPIVVRNSGSAAGGETWIGAASTDDAAGAFVVTSTPNLAAWHALHASPGAVQRIAPGNAVLAAVGPTVWGRAAELVRALDEAGIAVTALAGGIWHSGFIAIVPELAVERGVTVLHRRLAGDLRVQPRRRAAGMPWAALF